MIFDHDCTNPPNFKNKSCLCFAGCLQRTSGDPHVVVSSSTKTSFLTSARNKEQSTSWLPTSFPLSTPPSLQSKRWLRMVRTCLKWWKSCRQLEIPTFFFLPGLAVNAPRHGPCTKSVKMCENQSRFELATAPRRRKGLYPCRDWVEWIWHPNQEQRRIAVPPVRVAAHASPQGTKRPEPPQTITGRSHEMLSTISEKRACTICKEIKILALNFVSFIASYLSRPSRPSSPSWLSVLSSLRTLATS